MTLGEYLKDRRQAKAISQMQLAQVLEFKSAQFVSSVERDVAKPCRKKLALWVKTIDASPLKIVNIWQKEWLDDLRKDIGLR